MKVMCSNSMHGLMHSLLPEFERASGSKVAITYDPAKRMMARIRGGESADVAIIGSGAIDELAGEGLIRADTRVELARSSVGMAVAAGADKPDIATVDAFKAVLLKAQSVAYTIDGASGMHFAELIERLGVADAVKAKARRQPGGLVGELIARGEAEIAIQQVSELMAVPGIQLVGPIPRELQKITVVSGGIFRDAVCADAGRALLAYLTAPAARAVMQAKGLEPATT
jgi:molybdate transport system substrate-binding protein